MENNKRKVIKPRLEERETIINFDERYPLADIFTYNQKLQRRLLRYCKEHPECCRHVRTELEGAMTFYLDKARLSIAFTAPYSEERRKQYIEFGKKSQLIMRKH